MPGNPRVGTVVMRMGIDDMDWSGTIPVAETERLPDVEAILAGCTQLIDRVHAVWR